MLGVFNRATLAWASPVTWRVHRQGARMSAPFRLGLFLVVALVAVEALAGASAYIYLRAGLPGALLPLLFVLPLCAAAAIAYFIMRQVSRPLEALTADARRIAEGDYMFSAPLSRNDEIGQLSVALSGMTQSIAEREAALTSAIDALEMARRDAVAANEAKSQFLTNMSHELRTPLNAILGFGEMLKNQVLGPLGSPRYAEYARDLCASGEHLLGLVSRLSEVSDMEQGRYGVMRETFDAEELLMRTVESGRAQAEKAEVRLALDITCEVWPVVGDSAKLAQAFANILDNAIKFTPARGKVSVSAFGQGGSFVVRVEDTGIGMRAGDIALVTRPFYRPRSTFDSRQQGAGLGLPFAKAVAALHGGSLNIQSALGHGTTVEIVLPLAVIERVKAA